MNQEPHLWLLHPSNTKSTKDKNEFHKLLQLSLIELSTQGRLESDKSEGLEGLSELELIADEAKFDSSLQPLFWLVANFEGQGSKSDFQKFNENLYSSHTLGVFEMTCHEIEI